MLIYLSIAFFVGFMALFEVFTSYKEQFKTLHGYLFMLFGIFTFFFIGFRAVGFDYQNYYEYFLSLHSDFWKENANFLVVEKGYAFLNYIIGSYQGVLIWMAFVTLALFFPFIYKYSPYPFLSVLILLGIFFYSTLMGQYRQALAISFIFWAAVNRDKKIFSLFLILFASLFHMSSLLALLFFIIPQKLIRDKWYIILLLLALASNLLFGAIFKSYLDLLPAFIATKLDIYMNRENFSLGINLAMLLRLGTFGIFYYFRNNLLTYKFGAYFMNIYFLSLLIYLGLGFLPQLAGRGSLYFYLIECIIIPMLIFKLPGNKKVLIFSLYMGLSIMRQISFFLEWGEDYIPYKSSLFTSTLL